MSKQSSIEFVRDNVLSKLIVIKELGGSLDDYMDMIEKDFEQAKEMHRIEIEEAYWIGQANEPHPILGSQCNEYYKETFGGNNE